jgi:hypothetical protein
MLAPQMIVRSPRALLREPSEELIDRIVKQYLAEPLQPTRRINIDALIHRSLVKLDREIEATRVRGVLIYKQVRPKNFYEGKLDRYVPFTVPPISRALRGVNGRDVLLDSLVVEEGVDPVALRSAVTRISQAFWAYDEKLGDLIKTRANREIRTVGILQPIEGETTQNLLTTRDFIRETWSHHADVITGNQEDIRARLREHMGWVAAELV